MEEKKIEQTFKNDSPRKDLCQNTIFPFWPPFISQSCTSWENFFQYQKLFLRLSFRNFTTIILLWKEIRRDYSMPIVIWAGGMRIEHVCGSAFNE